MVDCCRCQRRVSVQPYRVTWSKLHPSGHSIEPCGSHTATLIQYNGEAHLLIYGGNNRYGEFYDTVYLYNVRTHTVQHVQTQCSYADREQLYRSGHVAAYYNNMLYVFGGQHIYGTEQSTQPTVHIHDTVYALNIDTMTWNNVTQYGVNHEPTCVGLNCSASVQYEQHLVTVGGATAYAPSNTVRVYTLPNNHQNKYTVHEGSSDKLSAREMSSVALFNAPSTHSTASEAVTILIAGGRAHATVYDDLYTCSLPLHTESQTSAYIDVLSTGQHPTRCAHTLLSLYNDLTKQYDVLSLAGVDGQQFYSTVSLYQHHTAANDTCTNCGGTSQWVELDDTSSGSLPAARMAHTITPIPTADNGDAQYIMVGGLNETEDLNDMWLLTVHANST